MRSAKTIGQISTTVRQVVIDNTIQRLRAEAKGLTLDQLDAYAKRALARATGRERELARLVAAFDVSGCQRVLLELLEAKAEFQVFEEELTSRSPILAMAA